MDETENQILGCRLQARVRGQLDPVGSGLRVSLYSAEVAIIATSKDTRDKIVQSSWRSKLRTMANSQGGYTDARGIAYEKWRSNQKPRIANKD